MRLELTNRLVITGVTPKFRAWLTALLTMPNPQLAKLRRLGIYARRLPRVIKGYSAINANTVAVPRGVLTSILQQARVMGEPITALEDKRDCAPKIRLVFGAELTAEQTRAVAQLQRVPFSVLAAPTGSGKTVMALAMAGQRSMPFLVLVHTKELLHQWVERIAQFLGLPPETVGVIGDGQCQVGQAATVALVQSLYRKATQPKVGFLIVDECHRCPSRTFAGVVAQFSCSYMLGLSATPYRSDGLTPLIQWYLGPVMAELSRQTLEDSGAVLAAQVICKDTPFTTTSRLPVPKVFQALGGEPDADTTSYATLLNELTMDPRRQACIANDVVAVANKRTGACLVLSDRKAYCRALHQAIVDAGVKSVLLLGDMPRAARDEAVLAIRQNTVRVLVATGQLIGEGFDCAGLSTLFLTTPVKFTGRLLQYIGRILRPGPDKGQPLIYDYVDIQVPVFARAFRERKREYKRLGWRVQEVRGTNEC